MPLRNLPTDVATSLAQMIDIRPGQVSSMALTRNAGFDLTLLAFAPGESVSEEEYFGDVLYYLVEGAACVVLPESRRGRRRLQAVAAECARVSVAGAGSSLSRFISVTGRIEVVRNTGIVAGQRRVTMTQQERKSPWRNSLKTWSTQAFSP